jgi:hypothetical protein
MEVLPQDGAVPNHPCPVLLHSLDISPSREYPTEQLYVTIVPSEENDSAAFTGVAGESQTKNNIHICLNIAKYMYKIVPSVHYSKFKVI